MKLIDSTLREGEQTVGVAFPLAVKIEIVELLALVGVEEIELGIAARRNGCLPALMKHARKIPDRPQLSLWSRCRPEDVDIAASLTPEVLSLSIPASDRHLDAKFNGDRRWALASLRNSLRQARRLGLSRVAVGLEDATRAEDNFLLALAATAAAEGAFRVRLADTVGITSPARFAGLVGRLRHLHEGLEIGVHTHNDFGMATANAVAALEAGATWADVTVLGLGERAGNARLEEVAGFLALSGRSPYRTEHLKEICALVSREARLPLSAFHPVVGEKIFACETGLHLQGLARDPATYEPYSPAKVGARRELLLGAKAGRRAVLDRLSGLGLSLPESRLETLVREIRRLAASRQRPLHDAEIVALAKKSTSLQPCSLPA